jgi:5-methylcytosine-specific restriction endonuclease McrA
MQYSKQYTDYLQSNTWKQRRQAKLEQADNKCQYCGETAYLQVHHITYKNLGDEQSNELIVLCTAHHWVADEIRRTGNMALLTKIDKPFEKVTPQKEIHKMTKREAKKLLRKKKHERKLLDKTIHRNNRRPQNGNTTRPLMAKGNRAIFISGKDGGKWVIADDLTTRLANEDGYR